VTDERLERMSKEMSKKMELFKAFSNNVGVGERMEELERKLEQMHLNSNLVCQKI
jgi:predicted nuclease with TOPRIM domain